MCFIVILSTTFCLFALASRHAPGPITLRARASPIRLRRAGLAYRAH